MYNSRLYDTWISLLEIYKLRKKFERLIWDSLQDYHQTRKQTADGPVAPHQKKYPNIPAGHTGSYDVDGTRLEAFLKYSFVLCLFWYTLNLMIMEIYVGKCDSNFVCQYDQC